MNTTSIRLSVFAAAEYVVVPSGSCAAMISHHFADIFQKEPQSLEASRAVSPKVWEFSSFLTDVAKVEDVGAELNEVVTYHDSCHGLRELHTRQEPRELLRAVRGLEFVEMSEAETCCGFGGMFAVKFPQISSAMAEVKCHAILGANVDYVVSNDSSCLMQIQGYLNRHSDRQVKSLHIAEVLAQQ